MACPHTCHTSKIVGETKINHANTVALAKKDTGMSYRTKKEVLAGIKTRRRIRNGVESVMYDAYLGYDPYSKKQKRMQSSDRAELRAQIERFYIEHRVGGDVAARLKPYEATDAREAIDLLFAHGEAISLRRPLNAILAALRLRKRPMA